MTGSDDQSTSAPAPAPRDADTARALAKVAAELSHTYEGTFSPETVAQVVEESYDLLAPSAKVPDLLPLLTQRFARDRLLAVAQAEGRVAKPTPEVLFLCVQNAGRSQMAAGFMSHLSGGRVRVRSAGSQPGERVNPIAAQAMAEVGVNLSEAFPKPLTNDVVRAADVIVTMGCGDSCPVYPGKRYLDWDLPDPAGLSLVEVRLIRDQIEHRVRDLLAAILPL